MENLIELVKLVTALLALITAIVKFLSKRVGLTTAEMKKMAASP
jgi:hypothetical protein